MGVDLIQSRSSWSSENPDIVLVVDMSLTVLFIVVFVLGMFATLEPLHAMMERGPQTLKETSFNQSYGRELMEAADWCRKYTRSGNMKVDKECWDAHFSLVLFSAITEYELWKLTVFLRRISIKRGICTITSLGAFLSNYHRWLITCLLKNCILLFKNNENYNGNAKLYPIVSYCLKTMKIIMATQLSSSLRRWNYTTSRRNCWCVTT